MRRGGNVSTQTLTASRCAAWCARLASWGRRKQGNMPRRPATPTSGRCDALRSVFEITPTFAASLPHHLTWYLLFLCCLFQLGTVLYLTLSSGFGRLSRVEFPKNSVFFKLWFTLEVEVLNMLVFLNLLPDMMTKPYLQIKF